MGKKIQCFLLQWICAEFWRAKKEREDDMKEKILTSAQFGYRVLFQAANIVELLIKQVSGLLLWVEISYWILENKRNIHLISKDEWQEEMDNIVY